MLSLCYRCRLSDIGICIIVLSNHRFFNTRTIISSNRRPHPQVCNSRMLRSKVVLGVFKLDLGSVYDQPMHAFVNKWLALTALDEDAGGVMGESYRESVGSHRVIESQWGVIVILRVSGES